MKEETVDMVDEIDQEIEKLNFKLRKTSVKLVKDLIELDNVYRDEISTLTGDIGLKTWDGFRYITGHLCTLAFYTVDSAVTKFKNFNHNAMLWFFEAAEEQNAIEGERDDL